MNETIERIQNWYIINCNGEWEHNYGYQIETLDNPGWSVKIDLAETGLENLEFSREYQNPLDENDWFNINTEKKVLYMYCGPTNLKVVFNVFFDELIPNYLDEGYSYEIYLPLKGLDTEVWIPAKSKLVNERCVQITEIKEIEYSKVKVRNVEEINFNQADLLNLKLEYSAGDIVEIKLVNVFDGIILTPK